MSDQDDLRYKRFGYIPQSNKSDELLADILQELPGDGRLPVRWFHTGVNEFLSKYGGLGKVLWSHSANAHALLINGHYVLRIWTDRKKYLVVDVNDAVVNKLHAGFIVYKIKQGSLKKSKPFTRSVKIRESLRAKTLIRNVREVYGI